MMTPVSTPNILCLDIGTASVRPEKGKEPMSRNGIDLIDPGKDSRWDAFVARHERGWIYHGTSWKRVLENSFSHMKGYGLVKSDGPGGPILAGLPLFLVSSPLTGTHLVSVPFGTLITPLVEDRDFPFFLDAISSLCSDLGCARIIIHSLDPLPLPSDGAFAQSSGFWNHSIALNKDPKDLFKTFDRTCVRQRVTRAQTSGLAVREAAGEADLKSFFALYRITRRRIGRPCHPYRFLRAVWNEYHPSGKCRLLLARKAGADIAGLIVLRDKGRASAEWAASDESFKHFSPNHLLFWEAIQLAHAEGDSIFDFGRTSQFNKGLMDFKNRWGTTAAPMYDTIYPRHGGSATETEAEDESRLKHFLSKTCRLAPDVLQEPIGKIVYRHLL